MKIKELLVGVSVKECLSYDENLEIKDLCIHSTECKKGSLFFAIRGYSHDGSNYISDAEASGAVAVVTECALKCGLMQIVVEDVRETMALVASNFYYNVHKELKIIGITGTNGKTTVTKMIGDTLRVAGKSVATIGTLGVFFNGVKLVDTLTTPDPIDLHRIFSRASLAGIEYVVMEVSAHSLALRKLQGVKFEVVALTNFTQDHLDFFGTMSEYKKAKKLLFSKEFSSFQVINVDDPLGIEIIRETATPFATYGLKNPSDVFAIDYDTKLSTKAIVNCFDDVFELKNRFIGDFNLYNALTAITVLRLLSVSTSTILDAFFKMEEVPGRFNILGKTKRVIIDFAHTPDGLKNLLESARKITEGRLILVFGCGGNRDDKKRSVMGKIAGTLADFTVITSDNPRYEDPLNIIKQIEDGHKEISRDYISILDRSHAINYAVTTASPRDTVVIAGKGAEDYLEVNGVKTPYSDRAEVLESFRRCNYE